MAETRWLQVSVAVDAETAEAVSEVFNRYAEGGAVVEIHPDGEGKPDRILVKGFLAPDAGQGRKKREVEEALWHLGQIRPIPEPQFVRLREADWAEAWKQEYRPTRVGKRLVIVPSWISHEAVPGQIVLQMDPGLAFGTGLHPTTQLCLSALEELVTPGTAVLDLGTGSGILAIACAKLGANKVVARDIDPLALDVARANIRANGVEDQVETSLGSEQGMEAQTFGLIVANILTHIIMEMVEGGLFRLLDTSGVFIGGGILSDWEAECRLVLAAHGLEQIESRKSGDWVTLVGVKGAEDGDRNR